LTDARPDDLPTIALARPEDLEGVLSVYRRSFSESMGVALGSRYNRRFLSRYLEDPDRIFLVARSSDGNGDGTVVGFAASRPVSEVGKDDRALAATAALGALTHPGIVLRPDFRGEIWRRLRNIRGATPPGPDLPTPTLSYVAAGVDPDVQSRGTGRALMEAMFEHAVERGYKSVRWTTYRDNPAQRLWHRLGCSSAEHPTKPDVLYYYWLP
jgi:ribosomal protein S18 acetylase RimI-like enzyme